MNRRMSWASSAALAMTLSLLTGAPVLAECGAQPNRWPSFSEVAPSAQRVVVGVVQEPPDFDDGYPYTTVFRLRVDEVLRDSAPEVIEVSGLRTGLLLEGPASCRENAYLYVRFGDVIAVAFDGRLPGVAGSVNTAAWIEGRPRRHSVPGVQQLTLDEVRYFASLPDTATGAAGSADGRERAIWHPFLLILGAAAGALAIDRRLRQRVAR